VSDLKWDATPSSGKWYGEVVYVSSTGETESNYGYCSDIAEYPSPVLLAEPKSQIMEVRVVNQETGDVWERWSAYESTQDYSG
jgi:hypothetical protein